MDEMSIGKIVVATYIIILVIAQILIYRKVESIGISAFHTLNIVELATICVFAAFVFINLFLQSQIPYSLYVVVLLFIVSLITTIGNFIIKQKNIDPNQTKLNGELDTVTNSSLLSFGLLMIGTVIYGIFESYRGTENDDRFTYAFFDIFAVVTLLTMRLCLALFGKPEPQSSNYSIGEEADQHTNTNKVT